MIFVLFRTPIYFEFTVQDKSIPHMAMLALLSHFRDLDGSIGEWKLVLSCCCFGPHKSREQKERKSKQGSKEGGQKEKERERQEGREGGEKQKHTKNEEERERVTFHYSHSCLLITPLYTNIAMFSMH